MSHCFVYNSVYGCELFSLNTPRCVEWYLDFSSCSIAIDLSGGLSFIFARALTSFFNVLGDVEEVLYLKSSMGLMWTPSILYDLFGSRYLMWVPFANEIELICSCSMV